MLKRIFYIALIGTAILLQCRFSMAHVSFIDKPQVKSFLQQMSVKHGFKLNDLNKLFAQVHFQPKVMKSINAPLEQLPWYKYQKLFLTSSHIEKGVEFWHQHEATLKRAEKIYGVPASIIVATIGVETKYGKNKGEYPVIEALTNIAFSDSKRAKFFKSELEEFLLLTREQHMNPLKVKGSYAGAMGQPQFMPSSFRYYAVNFSGKGPIDLSNDIDDVIGSIANYYKKHGWIENAAVIVPSTYKNNLTAQKIEDLQKSKLNSKTLNHYGFYVKHPLSEKEEVKLIALQAETANEYWIALHNFDVIKRYNPSNLYAMAVYQLSLEIANQRGKKTHA